MRKFLIFLFVLLCLQEIHSQVLTGSFNLGGYIRVYDVTLPSNWSPTANMPVVIDLHYLGADGRDEDSLTRFKPIANAEGFVVCHPYGLGTDWSVGQHAPYSSSLGDIQFIDHLIDTLQVRYGIDLQRVYATGMGQGGFLAQMLACELGNRIAAFATVGASIADSTAFYCHGSRPIPMMVVHGTADSVVPYYTGLPGVWPPIPDLLSFWRQRNNCAIVETMQSLPDLVQEGSTVTTHRWACGVGCEVLHYEVINGGFSWPGADRDLGSGGNRNMDIDASLEIWNFFKRFDVNGLVGIGSSLSLRPELDLFPNPATDVLHVHTDLGVLEQVTLRDLQGRLVAAPNLSVDAQAQDMDLHEVPNGVYLLEADGMVRRVVVMR